MGKIKLNRKITNLDRLNGLKCSIPPTAGLQSALETTDPLRWGGGDRGSLGDILMRNFLPPVLSLHPFFLVPCGPQLG